MHFERQLLCAQHGRGGKPHLARGESCSIPKHSNKVNAAASSSGGIYLRPASRWQLGRKSLFCSSKLPTNCSNCFSNTRTTRTIGNTQFKTVYKSRVPHTFRVITEGDAITSILTVGKGFSGIYRHAGLEVLLEDGCTGNILVGPTGRSPNKCVSVVIRCTC